MAFQKAPQPEKKIEADSLETRSDVLNTILAIEHDPSINRHANFYEFREEYKARGIDLESEFTKRAKTLNSESIKRSFLANEHPSLGSSLAESLPLYANQEGRLGEYIQVRVTRTAKQDDQGNSFIDLVVEIKNKWLATDAPKDLQDVPAKMTFLIDVTTSTGGERHDHKLGAFKDKMLLYAQKASVLCYKNEFGDLGIERPKIIVEQSGENLEKIGGKLGTCITQLAADKFSINRREAFDAVYREYFSDFLDAIAENARTNEAYLNSLEHDPKRAALAKEYAKMIKFIEAYKKTPITRPKVS